jgi:4-hydroxybenzoate polyprenyltransferase
MTPADRLPDAAPDNWVDGYAPLAWRPWLKLGRFDRPAGAWLLMLPGWQGAALASAAAGRAPDLTLLVKIALGAVIMRAAGCAYNDIIDRNIDAKVARTAARPIPSGQVTLKGAWLFIAACALAGLCILLTLSLAAIALGVASLGLVAAYPFMKRITWWPQAWLGLTFNAGALLGFAAQANGLTTSALCLYAGGVFWTLGYDTIYALQDLEDDALAGVKSSARRLGGAVRIGVGVFYALSVTLALAAGVVAGLSNLFLVLITAYGLHLARQVRDLRAEDPEGALRLFRSNRDAGLILFAAIALGAWNG